MKIFSGIGCYVVIDICGTDFFVDLIICKSVARNHLIFKCTKCAMGSILLTYHLIFYNSKLYGIRSQQVKSRK